MSAAVLVTEDVVDDSAWIAEHVTVLVTTSPARSDPELDLLRACLSSLALGGLSKVQNRTL